MLAQRRFRCRWQMFRKVIAQIARGEKTEIPETNAPGQSERFQVISIRPVRNENRRYPPGRGSLRGCLFEPGNENRLVRHGGEGGGVQENGHEEDSP